MRTYFGLTLCLLMAGCSFNNVESAGELKVYFDSAQVEGCFGLYDNVHNEFTLYNRDLFLKRFPPGGTFNILTTLTGLETGKLFDEKALIGGQTLQEAFRGDSVSFFRQLALSLGKDTLDRRIRSIGYGNMDTTGQVDSLWLRPGLAISADEQLGLVKKLYFNQLPFQQRSQQVLRDIMQRESTTNYTLSYVSGSGTDSSGSVTGWIAGWIVERRDPYFYVLNVQGHKGQGITNMEVPLLKRILASRGFFRGIK
jgi:beta-lactamase class D